MIVYVGYVQDGEDLFLLGGVDDHTFPPVKMAARMTRFEVELEGIRRFLRRHLDHSYISFIVDPYLADVLSYRRNPSCRAIEAGVNRVWYLVNRRRGPVHFRGRPDA